MVSVPVTASDEACPEEAQPQRTASLSVIVGTLSSAQNAIFPAIAVGLGANRGGLGVLVSLGMAGAVILLSTLFAYIQWRRLTYTIGAADIRVESGVLSRSARSVPYERIQDVSLEQKLLPRLLGLVAVKFETGAGGADDLTLTYLVEAEGERLRELIRERRDDVEGTVKASVSESASAAKATAREDQALFSMAPRRLFTFGLFEFSLAVFAVLAGLLQYADFLIGFDVWEVDTWRKLAEERGGWFLDLFAYAPAISVVLGLISVFILGSATGLVRTFNREWGFLLERTPRGFRRRRGLLTRTDVVMPVHRVQGITIATRFLRYRFGWHSLKFVSLAQDAGSTSHVVAPFAKLDELDPIVSTAGFERPSPEARWYRASPAYLKVTIALNFAFFVVAAIIAGAASAVYSPEWTWVAIAIPLALTVIDAPLEFLAWRFKRHTLEANQIASMTGVLSPRTQIATRVKLHSVEIAQGPLARRYGYATLHLGMAGGEMKIEGIPLERARAVRAQVLETIAQTDFSQLENRPMAEAA